MPLFTNISEGEVNKIWKIRESVLTAKKIGAGWSEATELQEIDYKARVRKDSGKALDVSKCVSSLSGLADKQAFHPFQQHTWQLIRVGQ